MAPSSTRVVRSVMAAFGVLFVVACSDGARRGGDGGTGLGDGGTFVDARIDGMAIDAGNDGAADAGPDGFFGDAGFDDDGGAPRECTDEVCHNGLDEDCDGFVDEDCACAAGATNACFGGDPRRRLQGVCRDGTTVCEGGEEFGLWTDCADDVLEGAEACDVERLDEDCDGTANEGCECEGTETTVCGTDEGECSAGTQACEGGRLGLCDGAVGPTVEICDGLDNDCDGEVDEDLRRICGVNVGECRVGIATCDEGQWGLCDGEIVASLEVCDGLDNDCDGSTDEATDRACGTDTGECLAGVERCVEGRYAPCDESVEPIVEQCNARDDDCDERIDEDVYRTCGSDVGQCISGRQQCSAGTWLVDCLGSVRPATEICNGLDDDCDSDTDEDLTRRCGTDVGECVAGTFVCEDGVWGETCVGQVGPVAETCNGLDDDCDDSIDENVVRSCGSNVGVCRAGTERCVLGVWQGTCDGEVGARTEVCDGVFDEDCDGTVDEACGCIAGTPRDCGTDVGLCERGRQVCTLSGEWDECLGAVGPAAETCDGYDNDCDDAIDEGDVCPRFPPTATCPAAENGVTGTAVSLAGAGVDPDGGGVMFEWSVTSRPVGSTATLGSAFASTSSFTPDLPGTYTFELCVLDEDEERTCCTTSMSVAAACSAPTAPALSVCGTSWDRRPIAEVTPLPAGMFYEFFVNGGDSPIGTVTTTGQNYFRPSSALAAGGPPPGAPATLSVRTCRSDAPACCSALSSGTVLLVEACSTPRAPAPGDLVFSEYIVDGDGGSCPGPSCEAGEAFEITNLTHCPITLSGNHFFYCNGSCAAASYRWMNFGSSDVIPPRGVYVAMRARASSTCSYPYLGANDSSLFGLRISSIAMNGMNLDTGWFANGGGRFRLATGAYSSPTDGTALHAITYSSASSVPTCGSNGYDAINRCGEITTSTTYPILSENQLGQLSHPCDAVVAPMPAMCR